MTARATAVVVFVALGVSTAFAVAGAPADPPVKGEAATVYRTVIETLTVNQKVEGKTIGWWRAHAIANRKEANARRITLGRIRRFVNARWTPTVRYALDLSRAVYGYDLSHRAWCESKYNTFAVGDEQAGGPPYGLMQFKRGTWRSTPFAAFSLFDPVAQALAGGWMVQNHRSAEWSCPL